MAGRWLHENPENLSGEQGHKQEGPWSDKTQSKARVLKQWVQRPCSC